MFPVITVLVVVSLIVEELKKVRPKLRIALQSGLAAAVLLQIANLALKDLRFQHAAFAVACIVFSVGWYYLETKLSLKLLYLVGMLVMGAFYVHALLTIAQRTF